MHLLPSIPGQTANTLFLAYCFSFSNATLFPLTMVRRQSQDAQVRKRHANIPPLRPMRLLMVGGTDSELPKRPAPMVSLPPLPRHAAQQSVVRFFFLNFLFFFFFFLHSHETLFLAGGGAPRQQEPLSLLPAAGT